MGVGWAAEFLFFLLGTVGNSPPFPCRLPVRQAQSSFPRSVELVPSSDSFIHCVLRVPFHDLYLCPTFKELQDRSRSQGWADGCPQPTPLN